MAPVADTDELSSHLARYLEQTTERHGHNAPHNMIRVTPKDEASAHVAKS